MKLLLIGGGNMGGAIAFAFSKVPDLKITILEKNIDRKNELLKYDFNAHSTYPLEKLRQFDVVIIAVKPQDASTIFPKLKDKLKENCLIISIMAGIGVAHIQKETSYNKVIRLMPNLPMLLGKGMTGAYASRQVSDKEKEMFHTWMKETGELSWVEDEALIDAVTAISGSGPAYVFYFMNSMYKQAIEFGFSSEEAKKMVMQTFEGAIEVMNHSKDSYEDWITKVSSKGGTTEAALKLFKDQNLDAIIKEGMIQARQRGEELNKL